MKVGISEVLKEAAKKRSKAEKIAVLKQYDSFALRSVLQGMYDDRVEFLLPPTRPPFTPSGLVENQGVLHTEARRLGIFAKNGPYPNLEPIRREILFIQLLESVHKDDAEILIDMIAKKKYKGISKEVVKEAFPGIVE